MWDFRCGWSANDEVSTDVHVRVVVDQLWACVGASCAGQTGIEWNAVIFVIPSVVDDVQFVACSEQSDWTRIIAEVAAVALVHLPLVAARHIAHQQEDERAHSETGDEHRIGEFGVETLRILVESRICHRQSLEVSVGGKVCAVSRGTISIEEKRLECLC